MSTPITHTEKDLLLKTLYDEKLPVVYFNNRIQHVLTLDKPAGAEMVFKAGKPAADIMPGKKLDLMFNYRKQVISFSIEVSAVQDTLIIAEPPEYLYKNLERSYSRISIPSDLRVQFTFHGDLYSLKYPRLREAKKSEEAGGWMEKYNPKNLQGLIDQTAGWISKLASGHKMALFKEIKPNAVEERIVAETGKSLFLPSTTAQFLQEDPYPEKRLITGEIFRRYLESTGAEPQFIDNAMSRFIKQKHDSGILSDAWVPILFQEYVIGYIHIWITADAKEKKPFDYAVIDQLYQFASVLAYSLKINGYFNAGHIKNKSFTGRIVDISVSGLLFAYPDSSLSNGLFPGSELSVNLIVPKHTINTGVKIVRRYTDTTMNYFGCHFFNMAPQDMRFFFEYLYGKPYTDSDAAFMAGQV
jgi:hypothetical protein